MRRLMYALIFSLLSVVLPQNAQTQPPGAGACPVVVERALQQMGQNCDGLGRSAACYGYFRVNALFNEAQPEGFFSSPADNTPLNIVNYVQAAPLDEATQQWGVAMLHLQANVPNTLPGQAVPFMLLGDTETANATTPDNVFQPAAPPLSFITTGSSNLRTLPDLNANILVTVLPETALLADALSPDGAWLRSAFDNQIGWINREVLTADATLSAQIDALPIFNADRPTPMQAFFFRTGIGQPTCTEAPSVMVAQGPERFAVEFSGNGARFVVGSTVALRTLTPDAPDQLALPDTEVTASVFDPTSRALILAFADGSVRYGNTVLVPAGDSPLTHFAVGANGGLAGLDTNGGVQVWNNRSGDPTRLELPQPAAVLSIAPDGKTLVTGHAGELLLWTLDDLSAAPRRLSFDGDARGVGFSPEGDQVAVLTEDGLLLFDLATGESLSQTSGTGSPAAFFVDGDRWLVAFATSDGITLWDVFAGQELGKIPAANLTHFSLSRRRGDLPGVQIAFTNSAGDVEIWEVIGTGDNATTSRRTIITGQFNTLEGEELLDLPGVLDLPTLMPDGTVIAFFSDGTSFSQQLMPDRMQLFVVEGETLADGLPVPEGFTSIVPLSFDPNEPWGTKAGDWSPPRPWTPEEFAFLAPIVGIPTNLLHYPIQLPGRPAVVVDPVEECAVPQTWTGEYRVQPGDTLTSIARRFNIDLFELAEGNCLENLNLIIPGQQLNLPGPVIGALPPTTPEPQVPALPPIIPAGPVLEIVSGNNQAATVSTTYASPLQVRLLSAPGGTPQANVTVTFNAPTGGPSVLFDGEFFTIDVTTDANGIATTPPLFATGCPGGAFGVSATAPQVVAPAGFSLNNTPPDTVVINNADAGPGSLREIIAAACPDQTVTFANAVFGILLATGEIFIDKNLTILGTDPINQAIDAQGGGRVFNVIAGNVTITGLQLTNGDVVGGDGGNILNAANLTLNNMLVTGGNGDNGGNIANTGTVTINGGNITGGTSVGFGGNIYNNGGTVTIVGGIVQGGNSGTNGGGISSSGLLDLTNTLITNNVANVAGGGIAGLPGAVTLINGGEISFNQAVTGGGGGIAMNLANVNLTNVSVLSNTALGSGGMVTNAGAFITGSTFAANNGAPAGGFEDGGGNTTILNSTFSNNIGSGVYVGAGVVNISFTTIADNGGFGLTLPAAAGTANVKNTLVVNQAAECNVVGVLNNLGGNIATDGTCPGFAVAIVGLDVLTGVGVPQYRPLLAGANPARDNVLDCTDTAGAGVGNSQNGAARPTGAACNSGSFED